MIANRNSLEERRNQIHKLQEEYERVKCKATKNLTLIKKGAIFGVEDHYDYSNYFPLELKEVIDEDDCMIRVFEPGVGKEYIISAFDVIVIGH